MPKRDKRVRTAFGVSSSPKAPRAEVQLNFNQLRPMWRVSLMEMRDPYGWHAIERGKIAEIHAKLRELESLTWNEILLVRKGWNHRIEVYKICKEAQDRLKELKLEDVDVLISLRLSGPERIWGIQQGDAVTLLWWDPYHQVYPYTPPNT